jgi:hypothetical protein
MILIGSPECVNDPESPCSLFEFVDVGERRLRDWFSLNVSFRLHRQFVNTIPFNCNNFRLTRDWSFPLQCSFRVFKRVERR